MAQEPYNKLLTNLGSSSRTGEYWPSVVDQHSSGQYSPVRPSRSVSKRLVFVVCVLCYQSLVCSLFSVLTCATGIVVSCCIQNVFASFGCVPLEWSGSGSVIQHHSDHGASKEPTNPLWSRIHRFLWCTMIRVILDHWSGSGLPQRNEPFDSSHSRTSKYCDSIDGVMKDSSVLESH